MNTLHSCLAYYLLAINAVTFIVYGIDKYKAKEAKCAFQKPRFYCWLHLEEASGHGWE